MNEVFQLCLVCLRVGALVFGGGLVMIPLMQADVVDRYHWLTQQEFVDAVALGQMTPGPVLVTASFVGYKVGGVVAAALATICIFLPSFVMTVLASNRLSRLQGNKRVMAFVKGVRPGVVGLIVAAAVPIARNSCGTLPQALLAVLALGALLWKRVDAGIVVVACGLIGLAVWSGS
ncbi:MAG: chromate transporter [Armatimonadetes bacterium]|nr:chromate transporter [Armatimonadota bacterium]